MDPFEYATGLTAIVLGLALGDMGISLHKLLRLGPNMRWSFRALASFALVATVVSGMWFQLWGIHARTDILRYPVYFSLVLELVLAFLMAAAVLPDEPEEGIDLAAFYEANARRLWTLFALFHLSYLAHWCYFVMTGPRFALDRMLMALPEASIWLIAAAMLAIWPRAKWLHRIVPPLLCLLYIFMMWDATLAPQTAG